MRIIVKAKPKSKIENIELIMPEQLDFEGNNKNLAVYRVSVKEPPINNRANEAILRLLAEFFHVSLSRVKIVSGQKARQKIVIVELASSLT